MNTKLLFSLATTVFAVSSLPVVAAETKANAGATSATETVAPAKLKSVKHKKEVKQQEKSEEGAENRQEESKETPAQEKKEELKVPHRQSVPNARPGNGPR